MTTESAKFKHLDFIQGAIARMASYSFVFKGWSITIAGALFAFAVVDARWALILIALGTTLLFWALDGYYLWLERGFVSLYEDVVSRAEDLIDFSMKIDKRNALVRWLSTCGRPHLVAFYGVIVAVEVISIFVV